MASNSMNPVVHFEMPYDDPGRMTKFYQAAFGWKAKDLGEKMGHYVVATTTESLRAANASATRDRASPSIPAW